MLLNKIMGIKKESMIKAYYYYDIYLYDIYPKN